jgi:glycosyltransferase involved in cell wall biosynthesis
VEQVVEVSIIIPFKDLETLQRNLLNSFEKNQDGIEVIFVHDSKTPLKQEQRQSLVRNNFNSKYMYGDFSSPGLARNRGLQEASGKWIVFWDSDDLGYPLVVSEILISSTANVIVANFNVSSNGILLERSKKQNKVNFSQIVANPGLWRFIMSSEVVKSHRFRDFKLGEDLIFLIECGALDEEIGKTQKVIYEYRISSMQSTKNMDIEPELEKLVLALVEVVSQHDSDSILTYGIVWRQAISLLKISRGKKSLVVCRTLFSLFKSLNLKRRVLFCKSLFLVGSKSAF